MMASIELPRVLGHLGTFAGDEGSRTAGVLVTADGTELRCVCTNGKILGILRLPVVPEGAECSLLIPTKEWMQAFKALGKKEKHASSEPVVILDTEAKRLIASGKTTTVVDFTPLEGRFPDYMSVLPRGRPWLRFWAGAQVLIDMLQVAGRIAATRDGNNRVEFFAYAADKPFGVVAIGDDDLTFDGLFMPLAAPEDPKKT
jgi:hypothetical protein